MLYFVALATKSGTFMLTETRKDHERIAAGLARLESELPFQVALLARLLERQIARILERHGLSLGPYRILHTVAAFGRMTPAELARYVVIDKGHVSRATAQLETAGLLETRADARDGRRKWLHLTAAGKRKLAGLRDALEIREDGLHGALAPLAPEDMLGALDRLASHVAASLR